MTTNVQNTRPAGRSAGATVDPNPGVEVVPTAVGGVAVYDRTDDHATDSTLHRAAVTGDPVPAEARTTGSILSWIIGAIVLVVLVYFLMQILF